jgi:hypothetical protein
LPEECKPFEEAAAASLGVEEEESAGQKEGE